jgi:hypothetical protein
MGISKGTTTGKVMPIMIPVMETRLPVWMKGHENLGRRHPWWYQLWQPDRQFSLRCENRFNGTMKGYED